jgi:hypothetical protein
MGSGIGSAPFEDLINAAGEALRAARSARLYIDTTPLPSKTSTRHGTPTRGDPGLSS